MGYRDAERNRPRNPTRTAELGKGLAELAIEVIAAWEDYGSIYQLHDRVQRAVERYHGQ